MGPSSYLRSCRLLQHLEHFVSVCSPFTLTFTCWWQSPHQRAAAAYLETAHTQPRGEDAGSGAIWRSVSDSRTLKNVVLWGDRSICWPSGRQNHSATSISCTSAFLFQLVPYVSANDLTNGKFKLVARAKRNSHSIAWWNTPPGC